MKRAFGEKEKAKEQILMNLDKTEKQQQVEVE